VIRRRMATQTSLLVFARAGWTCWPEATLRVTASGKLQEQFWSFGILSTHLIALPPHPRRSHECEAQRTLLLRIVDIVKNDCISGEHTLDLCFEGSHGGA
jgi:hypothetical protein